MANAFSYTSLAAGEIRVLDLIINDHNAPISCRLRHVPIDEFQDYEAVSYTWGTESCDRVIDLDKKLFWVTPNVEEALRQFRKHAPRKLEKGKTASGSQSSRCLWIDAICIDQANLDERSQQVKLMGRVYSNSSRLLVWLGVEHSNSDVAMRFIQAAAHNKAKDEEKFQDWIRIQANSGTIRTRLKSLCSFQSRPWFTRTWILQEYVLGSSGETLFHCGERRISLKEFSVLAWVTSSLNIDPYGVGDILASEFCQTGVDFCLLQAAHWERTAGNSNSHYLGYWLAANRHRKAKNPSDKVYGVLGILEHILGNKQSDAYDPEALIIDYKAEVQDVYSSVVRAIVKATGKLDILGRCSPNSSLVKRTWTPDWTVQAQGSYIDNYPLMEPTIFNASLNRLSGATISDDLELLTVKGILWDTIYAVFDDSVQTNLPGGMLVEMKLLYKMLWLLTQMKSAYSSMAAAKIALLRTIVMRPGNARDEEDGYYHPSMSHALEEKLRHDSGDWPVDPNATFWTEPLFLEAVANARQHKWSGTLVVTKSGWLGRADFQERIKEGDVVCIVLGCKVPMVLRPVGAHYEVIGDIFLDGIMFGEAIEALDRGEVHLQDFELH